MTSYKIFLDSNYDNQNRNLKVTKVKKTNYGFIIHLFSNYICTYYKYVTVNSNGTSKIVTKVNRNYSPKYQFTTYENKQGEKITLKEYKRLKN